MDLLRLLSLLALIASVAACADGAPAPPGTGGSTGTGATPGTGATGGTGGISGAGGTGGVGGSGGSGGVSGAGGTGGGVSTNACTTDPGDLEVIQLTTPNLRYWAARCATVSCAHLIFDQEMFVECVTTCVQRDATPSDQLSSDCANCYGELAWCAGFDCNTLCASTLVAICGNVACIGGASGVMICNTYGACLAELYDCTGSSSLDCGD